ncbi:MAG: 2Fe-2S iron-sulfur cluster binding domain-containing protein [Spirochaetales bacterium]|jgi:Na+-transporting NADH:ubiquinone oxidoreductase subunit F|nr:2Fe-2S iron-sulfur cluster binding domain-containing protein [Spirochaetales bacterium]
MIQQLLLSVGAISAIASLLAILMVITDATIGNYGIVKLTINNNKEYEVKGGRPLLATLMDEGIFIPSACGGRGSCGLCKVKVLEGAGQYLPTELPWISEDEKKQDIRLSCQVKVKQDFRIEIPEELFNVKEFRGRVESIVDLTHDIKEIIITLIEPSEIEIRAGQFIQFKVPEYELTNEPVYRAYSVASSPSDKTRVELEIRLVPGGIGTTYVHKYLSEGGEVIFNGPHGDFFLRDTDREIVCIAGGSGMAPIKSILLDMNCKGVNRRTRYFFGARSKRDLFLEDTMAELEMSLPDFTFIPTLSEPKDGDNWEGETGLVTNILDKHLGKGSNVEAYLCGSPGLIDACVAILTKHRVPEELIYYDKF